MLRRGEADHGLCGPAIYGERRTGNPVGDAALAGGDGQCRFCMFLPQVTCWCRMSNMFRSATPSICMFMYVSALYEKLGRNHMFAFGGACTPQVTDKFSLRCLHLISCVHVFPHSTVHCGLACILILIVRQMFCSPAPNIYVFCE